VVHLQPTCVKCAWRRKKSSELCKDFVAGNMAAVEISFPKVAAAPSSPHGAPLSGALNAGSEMGRLLAETCLGTTVCTFEPAAVTCKRPDSTS